MIKVDHGQTNQIHNITNQLEIHGMHSTMHLVHPNYVLQLICLSMIHFYMLGVRIQVSTCVHVCLCYMMKVHHETIYFG